MTLHTASPGRLLLAFDGTYITSTLSQLQVHGERGLVGGVFTPDDMRQSFLNMDTDKEWEVARVTRATTMMKMIVWNPSTIRKDTLSVCCVPLDSGYSGPGSSHRASWFMLDLLGRVLDSSCGLVRGVVFDSHGSHSLIRRVLHGQMENIDEKELEKMQFWKDIRFRALPPTCLPRLPVQLAEHQGEVIYGLPGICDSDRVSFYLIPPIL